MRAEQADGTVQWRFREKYILREAAKPYLTAEVYNGIKSQYHAPLPRAKEQEGTVSDGTVRSLTALQKLLCTRVTEESVRRLGFIDWSYVGSILEEFTKAPKTPEDGGIDRNARLLLMVLSFVVLQEKFHIPTKNAVDVDMSVRTESNCTTQ
jgi:asparagine synthase (glutamine-hydrolysing)